MLAKHKALTPGLREEQYERLAGKDAAESAEIGRASCRERV